MSLPPLPADLFAILPQNIWLDPIPLAEQCKRCTGRFPGVPQRVATVVYDWVGQRLQQCWGCAVLTDKEAKEDWSGGD